VFLWKACNNIIPTKENLKRRGVVSDDLCSICGQRQETVIHVLWECQSARDVWGCCSRGLQKRHSQEDDFLKLVENLTAVISKEDLGLFAVTAKGIWQRRNTFIHEGRFVHPNKIVNSARETYSLYQRAQRKNDDEKAVPAIIVEGKWVPPPAGSYKANWDAAMAGDHGKTGVGVIIRDDKGLIVAALSRLLYATLDP
jgi:hypothetical protein